MNNLIDLNYPSVYHKTAEVSGNILFIYTRNVGQLYSWNNHSSQLATYTVEMSFYLEILCNVNYSVDAIYIYIYIYIYDILKHFCLHFKWILVTNIRNLLEPKLLKTWLCVLLVCLYIRKTIYIPGLLISISTNSI